MKLVSYKRHRFPPNVIRHAIWLYFRFTLSLRDVEELLAQRGIEVSYETIRCWTRKFGQLYAWNLRRSRCKPTARSHLDEMVVKVGGERMWLWRAQGGAFARRFTPTAFLICSPDAQRPDQRPYVPMAALRAVRGPHARDESAHRRVVPQMPNHVPRRPGGNHTASRAVLQLYRPAWPVPPLRVRRIGRVHVVAGRGRAVPAAVQRRGG